MKHLVFLINRRSGVDRRKAITGSIERTLDKTKYSYEIQYTEYEKHGTELAKNAVSQGAYGVIVVGGDGSVNDAVKGLKGSNAILGIIPKGSGNGMARTLGIPLSVEKAIEVVNKGHILEIDVGYANEHAFVSNAGVGFDALIIDRFRHNKRRGFLSYCRIITQTIFFYKDQEWDITINGNQFRQKAFFINVANGKQLGYDFIIAPDADCTDGLLDVTVIKKFPKLIGALMAVRMRKKTLHQSRYAMSFQAKDVTIEASHLKLLQTDGDPHKADGIVHFRIEGKQKVFV